jgi:hypothetical protein
MTGQTIEDLLAIDLSDLAVKEMLSDYTTKTCTMAMLEIHFIATMECHFLHLMWTMTIGMEILQKVVVQDFTR